VSALARFYPRCYFQYSFILWDCGDMFRSPVSKCVSMTPLAKATDEGRQRAPLQSSRFLSETPSPLRFGIAHPGHPKLRHDIPVVPALPSKT
ncbi:hypothetical protein, partial [Hafnia sp. HMSC23F03]|uniref:hypothetical protein n=1 Tax=Hafnia sp. HMSC23F03 TaxID=1581059 RepID=UPI001FF06967